MFHLAVSITLVIVLLAAFAGTITATPTPTPIDTPRDSSVIDDGLPPSVEYWYPQIERWAGMYGQGGTLDPLVGAVIMTFESCGRPTAVSGSGAQGLFQVMPTKWPKDQRFLQIMQDPENNAERAYAWMNVCFQAYWPIDPVRAFGCYNGGLEGVSGDRSTWPAETQHYADLTSAAYAELITSQGASSPTIQAWRTPGDSFCHQAEDVLNLP
jgi:soluble lytic murein transglycosylase-like protein